MAETEISSSRVGIHARDVDRDRDDLFRLFEAGQAEKAGALIAVRGIDVEAVDAERLRSRNPKTLMALAMAARDTKLLEVLLAHSPILKSMDPARAGAALLGEAARWSTSRKVLLKAWRLSQRPDEQDMQGFSPLGRAIERGDVEMARFFLERGADPHAPAQQSLTAMEAARRAGPPGQTMVDLLESPLDQLTRNFLQRSAEFDAELVHALSELDLRGAMNAADKGAVLRWGDWGSAETPASFETCSDADEEARELLRKAMEAGRADIARFFLMETPISRQELFTAALAASAPDKAIYAMAIGGFLETALPCANGSTLLHESVARKNELATRALIEAAADPEVEDAWGRTAMSLARDAGFEDFMRTLAGSQASADAEEGDDEELAGFEVDDNAWIEVFPRKSIESVDKRALASEADKRRLYEKASTRMKAHSGKRIGAPAPQAGTIEALAETFPTFAEVIEDVAARAAITRLAAQKEGQARAFKIQNILLVGEPGIGKTEFLSKLAEACASSFQVLQMGATSAGFILSGVDSGWSSAKTGKIFDTLADGRFANPVILLDEIDKATKSEQFPIEGPMYSMLERGSAKTWSDEFVDVPMDVSHINFFASANDLSTIGSAILSRFSVYEIPRPSPEEALKIARSVYREVLAREGWGSIFSPELPGEMLELLAGMTPREAHIALSNALPKAVAKGRDMLRADDFKAPKAPARRIGFF